MIFNILKVWGELVLGLTVILVGCPLLYLAYLKFQDWFLDLSQNLEVLVFIGILLFLALILAIVTVSISP